MALFEHNYNRQLNKEKKIRFLMLLKFLKEREKKLIKNYKLRFNLTYVPNASSALVKNGLSFDSLLKGTVISTFFLISVL
jgi:hypothetical protein